MKKFNEEARPQSLHGGEPQTSRRPQWGIAGWAACWPKTSAYRLLHEDKALVFGTKDCRLEFCQSDDVGKECIATPDHTGLLECVRRRFPIR